MELPKRKNTRLKEFDYSESNYYFITICMKNRRNFFSNVINDESVLSKYGKIIDEVWNNLPNYYNVELDYYVIMPDHFHGILIIDNSQKNKDAKRLTDLSKVIGKYKSFSIKKIREKQTGDEKFEWQKSFYDRIIRNEVELYNIRKYIRENPLRWDIEKNNPENLEM
jgi:REP element-mobilizing transposase RayT